MSKIVVANDCSIEAIAVLRSVYPKDVTSISQRELTKQDLKNTEGLLVRSGTKVNKELLDRAPKLKVVVSATAGFDHLDLSELKTRRIAAMHCPGAHTESTAQLTMAHFLNLTRSMHQAESAVRLNKWRSEIRRRESLESMQLGIVGYGRIGKRVAELSKAFGMKVVAHDPYLSDDEFTLGDVTPMSLIEVFKTSDIVTFHVPLTKETFHMVNERTLEHFHPEAYLVNVSRGGVVNEMELAVKMRTGFLSGAALDVFEKEPLKSESPLKGIANIIFSAHIGAYTVNAFEKGSMEAARKLLAYLKDGKLTDQLPPNAPWAKQLIATPV